MASRSSSSTQSPRAKMTVPSERSRGSLARPSRASASQPPQGEKGPAEKKHKNMAEVKATGRQSDQGGNPGAGKRRSSRG
jgi:hypothetical protein